MNREIDEKFDDLLSHMQVFEHTTAGTLQRIESQTLKTNGRVNELEVQARVSRAKLNTAIAIFTFLIASVAIPLIASFIQAGKL